MSVIPHDVIKDSMTEREYQFKRKKKGIFFISKGIKTARNIVIY